MNKSTSNLARSLRRFQKLLPKHSWAIFMYWLLLLGALIGFIELASEVYEKEGFWFDVKLLSLFHQLRTPMLDSLARLLTFLGSAVFIASLSGLIIIVLGFKKHYRAVWFYLAAVAGAILLNLAAKQVFTRTRPALYPQLTPEHSFSFPSGHTMASAAFFLSVFLLVARFAPTYKGLAVAIGSLLIVGVGLSRVYLQVHFPSDVLAGWLLSTFWVMGVNLFYAPSNR